MRLRQFHAQSVPEAMQKVRESLGEDAIILATRDDPDGGVSVTAALEDEALEEFSFADDQPDLGSVDIIAEALAYHKVPKNLSERLLQESSDRVRSSWREAFQEALGAIFRFGDHDIAQIDRPILLLGTPGVGRSAAAARLALRYRLAGQPCRIVTLDGEKAGGLAQITTFAKALSVDLAVADSAEELARRVADSGPDCQLVIDAPGCNPLDEAALARLGEMLEAAKAKAVTVLSAGGDTAESAETALAFASLGTESVITTKLDLARRYGGLLSAAFVGGIALAAWSRSGSLGTPLAPYSSATLTDLLLPEIEDSAPEFDLRKTVS